MWSKLKIPLVLQVITENEKIIKQINKSNNYEEYIYDDKAILNVYYQELDNEIFDLKDSKLLS